MQKRTQGNRLAVTGLDTVMEGADMRALVLTLAAGECVPWHYHSDTMDQFFCLVGPMVVETRAPRAQHELQTERAAPCLPRPRTMFTARTMARAAFFCCKV